ncbi:beta-galactosidase [Paractinoplanes abujensis]|uniref:beta-galactosidase n=1 Tax=Paractinoplanes abujensis TaxID=882441 RepID=A0A7W7G324_9ACTN|nr:beta-galactosidase [Actinoplanes abujensis]MBB4692261.1 beta-galactosidase [Actinoplanes abujensis]GID24259.1 beta-galactosidase [Actinoplanes abujensis]
MTVFFGGDYNPEQWPPAVWREDVALMRSAGVNLVTVGVFSWSRLQPAAGTYEFGWLDDVLDLLHDNGIGVCLATPTASPPPWFTRAHPDAMPVTADGVRLTHGSRDTYCVNAPAYRAASQRIAGALGERYGRHPALRLWHVHNEYGTTCYCDHCAAAFRRWLARTYGGTGVLNDAWSTDFWSQRYGRFDEVLPPRATQYLSNPAHVLDYRRFVSDAMLAHYTAQRDVLRASGVPVTTNFVLGGWVPVDHARWAREVDVVAVDDYPSSLDAHLQERAFVADLARGWAGGEPWILMEHAPGAVRGTDGVTRVMPPGQARAAASVYLDGGAGGVLYFQWRAGRGGAEQWHPAMVPQLAELAPIGRSVSTRTPVRVDATRALVYDEPSMWAWQSPHLPTPFIDYTATAQRWHRALGPPVDVVPLAAALDGYHLVVAPLLHLVSAAGHKALRSYAESGGTLVLTFGSGLADEHCRLTPGAFDDLAGIRLVRHRPGELGVWLDEIDPLDATVVLTADDRPVVTEHRYGRGLVRYVAADLPDLARWVRS